MGRRGTNVAMRRMLLAALAASLLAGSAIAQTGAPMPAPIPAPQDVAYPGTITLDVDITDVARGIFRVRETIPIAGPGPITLLYPQWLPGNHAPRGAVDKLAGLTITANGQRLQWRRDPVNVYAFHVVAPAGASALELNFQFVSPTDGDQGRVVATPMMANLQWQAVVLYPAGHYARRISIAPSLTLPPDWHLASALDGADIAGATTRFEPVDLETLVDLPVFAGRHFNRVDLGGGVNLNLFGDRADQIDADEDQLRPHRQLVRQAAALFGGRPYDHYEFLLAMSDDLGGIGLEHHRSSENATGPDYFTEWDDYLADHSLLPHEFTHAWNGKYRRPADLWTPNYDVPMRGSLLWVYEGQTQYWGYVLAARAGFWTREETMDALARQAALYDVRRGRDWRALEDTTNDPIAARRQPEPWRSWQRSEDYYSEGLLIWLEADTLIRERSRGRRSLDNFARSFFAATPGDWQPRTYTFDDVVAALNQVEPYDWATLLRARISANEAHAPLDGLTRGGYRLAFTDERSDFQRSVETTSERAEFLFSIGVITTSAGRVTEVLWDSPAFNQSVTVGSSIVSVNGVEYSHTAMRRIITDAKTNPAPIELIIRDGTRYRTLSIDYHDGLRYPTLERVPGTPDRLSAILAPR